MTNQLSGTEDLFTRDPFPAKGEDSESSYISKGTKEDNVVLVNSAKTTYRLNRASLRETLQELKMYASVPITQLKSDQSVMFTSVVDALRLLKSNQENYDLILSDVRKVFSSLKEVQSGTVAAFFLGCFSDDKFPGPRGCSPKCAASLPAPENSPGYSSCDDLVLSYNKGELSSLNSKQSSHAYVYVGTDFSGFNSADIKQLTGAGVTSVSMVYADNNGGYRQVEEATPIKELPLQKNKSGVLVLFMAIILLILIMVYFFRSSWQKGTSWLSW